VPDNRVQQPGLARPGVAADQHVPLDQRHPLRLAELVDPDVHRVED
jgi:hypothetical protein